MRRYYNKAILKTPNINRTGDREGYQVYQVADSKSHYLAMLPNSATSSVNFRSDEAEMDWNDFKLE